MTTAKTCQCSGCECASVASTRDEQSIPLCGICVDYEIRGYLVCCARVPHDCDGREIEIGDYVETVSSHPDVRGAGLVLSVDRTSVVIGWDSGDRTDCPDKDLRVVPQSYQSRHGADHGLPTT